MITPDELGVAMYDLRHGQIFGGPSTRPVHVYRPTGAEREKVSRTKIAAVLFGLMIGATTAAGAVTVHQRAYKADNGFTAQWSGSYPKTFGATGMADALY